MARDRKAAWWQQWVSLVTVLVALVTAAITVAQRLTAVETGLDALRELVATRFGETEKRMDSIATDIHSDVREIRQILMDGHPPPQSSGLDDSGVGKRRN
jgi:hypothetical protein